MKSQRINGGGGVQLHVVEAGNTRGRPILFIHGFSQCWLAWSRQLNSALAEDHRLVAVDLRGHGQSDRPSDGYGDSRLWADDIDAVIRTLRLEQPILCGWSYGFPALDYIRHYGDNGIAGLQLVGAITKIGTEEAMSVISPEFLSLVPASFPRTSMRASAVSSRCYVYAFHKRRRLRICNSCWATTYRFPRTSARRCSPAQSTTTTFWRRFVNLSPDAWRE